MTGDGTRTGDGAGGDRRELILYATPTGPLADAIMAYFERVDELGSTTAQSYPPHCTLTGFFRRDSNGTDRVAAELAVAIRRAGPPPVEWVEVVQLMVTDRWVGLELRSPWMLDFTARFVDEHGRRPGDDPIRLKDWLHLSLAYGLPELGPHARLACDMIDPSLDVGWELALWERHPDQTWTRYWSPGSARMAW